MGWRDRQRGDREDRARVADAILSEIDVGVEFLHGFHDRRYRKPPQSRHPIARRKPPIAIWPVLHAGTGGAIHGVAVPAAPRQESSIDT